MNGEVPRWLAPKAAEWSRVVPVQRIEARLRAAEKLDFQRSCVPLLSFIMGATSVEAPDLRSIDAAGVDVLAWGESDSHLLGAFQCKGWQVAASDLGESQAEQCIKSIAKFAGSGLTTDGYVLLHNRDPRMETFREPVLAALEDLRQSGVARWVALWQPWDLIKAVCNGLAETIQDAWLSASSLNQDRVGGLLGDGEVTRVPYLAHRDRFENRGLRGRSPLSGVVEVSDPLDWLLAENLESGTRLVLGEFGFGKTTTSLRLAKRLGRKVLFLPAAAVRYDRTDSRALFDALVPPESLGDDLPLDVRHAVDPLVGYVSEKLLSTPRPDLLLVVDGLDEAPLAHRNNGLAQILNSVAHTRIPVVMTTRTEFWYAKTGELDGALAPHRSNGMDLPTIELKPWGEEQLAALVTMAMNAARARLDALGERHLQDLSNALRSTEFAELYGSIPRRPLFLRMLLDDVEAHGLRTRTPVELMHAWVSGKLQRDWQNPQLAAPAGAHRPGLAGSDETVDRTLALAWTVMDQAGRSSIRVDEEDPSFAYLDPDVDWTVLRSDLPWLEARHDLSALCLRTLLVPPRPLDPGLSVKVRFAHRAFQEFFAARGLLAAPQREGPIPSAVSKWLTMMRDDNYLTDR